jgi:lipopolysaccharide biosynthesis protein
MRTAEVLADYSKNRINKVNWPKYGIRARKLTTKLAVIVHVFYGEEWQTIAHKLSVLGKHPYDLFITLPMKRQHLEKEIHRVYPDAQVFIVPNRGRDVLPFMHLGRRLSELGYEQMLKLHTKKSPHLSDGSDWFSQILNCLLPNEQSVSEIIDSLSKQPGMIGANGHYVSMTEYAGYSEEKIKSIIQRLYGEKQANAILTGIGNVGFFASTMFWISSKAINPVLKMHFLPDDFEAEKGQIDGTTAHALERTLTAVAREEGACLQEVNKQGKLAVVGEPRKDFPFVPRR